MFIDFRRVTSTWSKETPFMTTWEELKKEAAKKELKKLMAQSLRRTEEDWTKNES